jgi:hypothetical protein
MVHIQSTTLDGSRLPIIGSSAAEVDEGHEVRRRTEWMRAKTMRENCDKIRFLAEDDI